MVLVHEAMYDPPNKLATVVKVTAGEHSAKTDPNAQGMFQQPMHILVEQGTQNLLVELLDNRGNLLATLRLGIVDHVLCSKNVQSEMVYTMKPKDARNIRNPRIKLTMVVNDGDALEKGTLGGPVSDVDILVRQQLNKAKHEKQTSSGQEEFGEMDVLKEAACGPLELFEGLGTTKKVYVAVIGPPVSRRWVLGIWDGPDDFEKHHQPKLEVDLMKIQGVKADPTRNHVFVVHCYDAQRVRMSLTFRRLDRARDVWVEILRLLVSKARESKQVAKVQRTKSASHHSNSGSHYRLTNSSSGDTEKKGTFLSSLFKGKDKARQK